MADIERKKYAALMGEIEDLEDRVADLEKEVEVDASSPNPQDVKVIEQELDDLRAELATKKNELARLSDGCGKPHPM